MEKVWTFLRDVTGEDGTEVERHMYESTCGDRKVCQVVSWQRWIDREFLTRCDVCIKSHLIQQKEENKKVARWIYDGEYEGTIAGKRVGQRRIWMKCSVHGCVGSSCFFSTLFSALIFTLLNPTYLSKESMVLRSIFSRGFSSPKP